MKQIKPYLFILLFLSIPLLLIPIMRKTNASFLASSMQEHDQPQVFGLLVHGGAGQILPESLPQEQQDRYRETLENILRQGYQQLEAGDSAVHVVQSVVSLLEDSPLFNAGKGAVLNAAGEAELDASIMSGKDLNAGAVAGVKQIKNPIQAAYALLQHSPHVLLVAEGAEAFAREQGLDPVENDYFITEKRRQQYHKKAEGLKKYGTVGCVVLDKQGNLAAGTSTGGTAFKQPGRVGDSPIIGAGTYADNRTCAVSCTGHGEWFIRLAIAHGVSERMHLLNNSLDQSVKAIVKEMDFNKVQGGLIALDQKGNYSVAFNTEGMFRGVYLSHKEMQISFFHN